jgi:hypothetical protein
MGYGKFEYTREGVTHARGIYPVNLAGCAITSLNSPSDSEIGVSPSPQAASLTSYQMFVEGVMQYGESFLGYLAFSTPAAIWFVARAILEHAVTDARDVAGNSMACVVFSYSLSQEMIVVVSDGVVAVDRSKRGSLVDRFEHVAVAWFPPAVTASATKLLVFDQSAVAEVFSDMGKSLGIHHTGDDLHCSNNAHTGNPFLEAHQGVAAGNVAEAAFKFSFAAPVQVGILVENARNEGGGLPAVSVAELERGQLVEDADTRAHNVLVGTDQKPEFIQATGTVIDLCEKSRPEELA